ncbi:MAG: ATP-binding protein, partial [Pseudonocardia sp.]|nr:ATP-binding protein [Pseudonocardia sp.]
MTTTDRRSATLPAEPVGAVWRRVALQVNPFSYQGMRAPRGSFPAEEAYNTALVEECQRLGIDMIGITDHWRVDGSICLIDAAEAAGIAALPGFEAVSSEGIHVLVLFERGTPTGDVDAAIGACGGRPGCASGQTGSSFAEIVTCAVSRGALAIPAHVNGPDGVLTGLVSGAATITAWRNPEVHAVAVSPGRDVDAHQQQVLANRDPEYERPHPVAVLYADDISDPARLGTPGGSCWVKMAVPSLAALRLAVRTPATRTSLVDPTVAGYPVIDAIAWQGGFLDGVALRFSPSLTCLIGGRGTGKSTVVESLRYGLGLEPIGASATRGHRQTVTSVLQPGTQVRISLRTGGGTFTVERTVPEPPTVRDAAGTLLASTPVDVLGPVEVFSQHELAELAESPDYVAELLRRFGAPTSPGRASVPTALRSNRKALLAATRDLEALDEQLADLPRQREALARFEAEGLDTRLAERAELDRQQIVLKTATERVSDVAATVEPLRDPGALDDAFARERTALATSDGGEGVDQRVTGVLARLRAELAAAAAAADTAVAGARRNLAELERDWSGRTAEARAGYEAALRALQDSGLDA